MGTFRRSTAAGLAAGVASRTGAVVAFTGHAYICGAPGVP